MEKYPTNSNTRNQNSMKLKSTRINVRLYVLESVLGWSVERLGPFYSGYLSPNSLTMDIFAIRIIRLHFKPSKWRSK